MKATLVWLVIIVLVFMAGLAWLRVPFARRFFVNMRRLGYLYVGLIVVLAAVSLIFGVRL